MCPTDNYKINTCANSDGLLNCLRQTGQLRNQPPKSMRVKSLQLIKSCGSLTVTAAETKSIGLPADACVSWFLQRHLDNVIVTRQLSSIYRDLVPFDHLS
jgi:hypothetical protein